MANNQNENHLKPRQTMESHSTRSRIPTLRKYWGAVAIYAVAVPSIIGITRCASEQDLRSGAERASFAVAGYETAVETQIEELSGLIKIENGYRERFSAEDLATSILRFRDNPRSPGSVFPRGYTCLNDYTFTDDVREQLCDRLDSAYASVEDAIQSAFPK